MKSWTNTKLRLRVDTHPTLFLEFKAGLQFSTLFFPVIELSIIAFTISFDHEEEDKLHTVRTIVFQKTARLTFHVSDDEPRYIEPCIKYRAHAGYPVTAISRVHRVHFQYITNFVILRVVSRLTLTETGGIATYLSRNPLNIRSFAHRTQLQHCQNLALGFLEVVLDFNRERFHFPHVFMTLNSPSLRSEGRLHPDSSRPSVRRLGIA